MHEGVHHGPFAVCGDEETVQIEFKAVLYGRTVDLGD